MKRNNIVPEEKTSKQYIFYIILLDKLQKIYKMT